MFLTCTEQNKNYIPYSKTNQAMIRIYAKELNFGNIFSKSKTNMNEDKEENFRMEIVKKRLGFCNDSICRVDFYLPLMFRTCAVKTLKL